MAKRPHGGDEEFGAKPRGKSRDAGSIRGAETVVAGDAHGGRVGAGATNQSTDFVTYRHGEPGGMPEGQKAIPGRDLDEDGVRALDLENSAAVTLAQEGWLIRQNPTPDEVARARSESGDRGHPAKNPDYLIEGRVFDCYSPRNPAKTPYGIWGYVRDEKIEPLQTQRVVINLEDWRGDLSALFVGQLSHGQMGRGCRRSGDKHADRRPTCADRRDGGCGVHPRWRHPLADPAERHRRQAPAREVVGQL